MAVKPLVKPEFFLNRSLSWLAFNRRVLEEAEDERNPLLERVKYLAITASNLDEFFEIRVAGLLQHLEDGLVEPGPDGLTPMDEQDLVVEATHGFVRAQYECWNQKLLPALAEHGIRVHSLANLTDEQREVVDNYCRTELDALLTPVTVDPAHPFPRVLHKALCQALLLRRRRRSTANATYMGVVTVPRALPRLVRLPDPNGYSFIALADLVGLHAGRMYRGYEILSEGAFRITRNSNLYLQEEESRSVLESVRTELHNRRKGDEVRLEIESDASEEVISRLQAVFELQDWQVYRTQGPVNLSRLAHLYSAVNRPELKFKSFQPREWSLPKGTRDIWGALRQRDVLLHHPFDSYNSVVSFIEAAAQDPAVLSIKQTLYRTNEDSPIVEASPRWCGRGEGALRRGLKHSLGARVGGRGRAGLPRTGGAEDPLQADTGGAQGTRRSDPPLRASGHGQLQSSNGGVLYRLQPAHCQPGDDLRGAQQIGRA